MDDSTNPIQSPNYDKIILIASKRYDLNSISTYNTLDYSNACIVTFNKILPSQSKLFRGIYHIRFMRGFPPHVLPTYKIIGHVQKSALHYIYKNINEIKRVNHLKNVIQMNDKQFGIEQLDSSKSNSLGYVAYRILSTQYPDIPIYLVGFTFLKNHRCHNGEKERDVMLSDPRVTVL